jgi:hypothetical protein
VTRAKSVQETPLVCNEIAQSAIYSNIDIDSPAVLLGLIHAIGIPPKELTH